VVVPTKGIALPLLSAGGTGWVITAFAIGLIAALDNANALEAEANAASPAGEASAESSLALSRDRASADGSAADGESNRSDDDSDGPRLRLVS
jgi:hypothetical protein